MTGQLMYQAVWNQLGIRRGLGEGWIMPLKWLCTLAYWGLFALFAAAMVRRLRARALGAADGLLFANMLAASLPFLVVLGQDRYHFPLVPFAAIGAATILQSHSPAPSGAKPGTSKGDP